MLGAYTLIYMTNSFYFASVIMHGVVILNRSNNSLISIEISGPQQAGGFIMKHYFGISNITACR